MKATVMKFEPSKEYLEWVKEQITAQQSDAIADSLTEASPPDVASLLYELDTDNAIVVINSLNKEFAADVLSEIDDEFDRKQFIKNFTPIRIAGFVDFMDSDDAADIINELPPKSRQEVMRNLKLGEHASNIAELLRYEEDTAGGLMAKELIKANKDWTVIQTIDEIRRQTEHVEKIYTVYVVDDAGKLMGRVSLKRIILATDKTRIEDIYDPNIASVETFTDEREIAALMRKYDLEVIPVVNVQGKLVGRITIDDILDVMHELAEEERQLMAGISEDVEEDDSIWMLTRARLPWLIIGLGGGLLGAKFIGLFEEDILLVPALAFFIPLITATGGNVGIQSSSLMVQSLANKSAFAENNWGRLFKVLLVAVLNGLILAALVFGVSFFFESSNELPYVVSIALFAVVVLASFMGTITPMVLEKLSINPALASGPFITTANDLLGLLVYFWVAHLLYTSI